MNNISYDEEKMRQCPARLKILADPHRFAIMRRLLCGPRHVGELSESLALEQSLVSHHLKVLRDSRLVKGRREGKRILYLIAPGVHVADDAKAIDLGCCTLSFPCCRKTKKPKVMRKKKGQLRA